MAIPTSVGGDVGLGAGIVIEPTRWQGTWGMIAATVATSAPGGTKRAGVRQNNAWRVELPWDSAAYPSLVGLERGAVIADMYFLIGSSGRCDHLTETTVLTVEKSNDTETDVPRVAISGEGGTVEEDVDYPFA